AIDRRDERGVEPLDDLVGDLVTLMLDFLDGVGLRPSVGEVVDQLVEQPRALDHVLGLLLEQIEEANLSRYQIEHGRATKSVTETSWVCQQSRRGSQLSQGERRSAEEPRSGHRPDGMERRDERRRAGREHPDDRASTR